MSASLVIGGASDGVGGVIARRLAGRADDVIITSRDSSRAEAAAKGIGGRIRGLAVDLSRPEAIAAALDSVTDVDNVVISAMEFVPVTLADFRIDDAVLPGRSLRGRVLPAFLLPRVRSQVSRVPLPFQSSI